MFDARHDRREPCRQHARPATGSRNVSGRWHCSQSARLPGKRTSPKSCADAAEAVDDVRLLRQLLARVDLVQQVLEADRLRGRVGAG